MADTQPRFIDVHGSLQIDIEQHAARVEANGAEFRVLLSGEDALAAVLRGLPAASTRRNRIAKASRLLARLGLTAEVVLNDQTLLRAGHRVDPSVSAKLARLGPLHAKLATLVKLYRLQK